MDLESRNSIEIFVEYWSNENSIEIFEENQNVEF